MSALDVKSDAARAMQELAAAFSATDIHPEPDCAAFDTGEYFVLANVVDAPRRIRIRVYLDRDDEHEVKEWVDAQPTPSTGLLEADDQLTDDWQPRLVFERPLTGVDWSTDPLWGDIERYLAAWLDDASVQHSAATHVRYLIPNDPRDISPESAWLLKGSEASFPDSDELEAYREAAGVGIYECAWTTASQTRAGDIALIYFISPRKAVHFVARAASDAFFSRDIEVNADSPVNNAQWWAYFTNPIAIQPISVAELRRASGGYLPLRGRSGLYLPPETISALSFRAEDPSRQAELDRVLTVPVGRAELPKPRAITHAIWRDLAAGALPLEAHVSSHLVEPLLRDLLAGTGLTWQREYPVGRRRADFVILDGDVPVHVIEVKKVIKHAAQDDWGKSPDLAQLRWYADQLDTPGTLIDSHRVLLVQRDGREPWRQISRRSSTTDDLDVIRRHLRTP